MAANNPAPQPDPVDCRCFCTAWAHYNVCQGERSATQYLGLPTGAYGLVRVPLCDPCMAAVMQRRRAPPG